MIEGKGHFQVHFTQGLKDQGITEMQTDEKSTINALWIMFHDLKINKIIYLFIYL
jgi:hypothetical protein